MRNMKTTRKRSIGEMKRLSQSQESRETVPSLLVLILPLPQLLPIMLFSMNLRKIIRCTLFRDYSIVEYQNISVVFPTMTLTGTNYSLTSQLLPMIITENSLASQKPVEIQKQE